MRDEKGDARYGGLSEGALDALDLDPGREARDRLSDDWRVTAMRQWLRGPRMVLLLVGLFGIPALHFSLRAYDQPSGELGDIALAIAAAFGAPLLSLVFSLVAIDGAAGFARFADLRTIPGGPRAWALALISTSRSYSGICFVAWGVSALLASSFDFDEVGSWFLLVAIPTAWAVPYIVAAVRLSVPVPIVDVLMLLGFCFWPGIRWIFEPAFASSGIGTKEWATKPSPSRSRASSPDSSHTAHSRESREATETLPPNHEAPIPMPSLMGRFRGFVVMAPDACGGLLRRGDGAACPPSSGG